MIKFPYGISDFYRASTEGYFYIDRTDRIPLIEQAGDQLLFLRPRRFGKSMLLSMLENYYDLARAEAFHAAFTRPPTTFHARPAPLPSRGPMLLGMRNGRLSFGRTFPFTMASTQVARRA